MQTCVPDRERRAWTRGGRARGHVARAAISVWVVIAGLTVLQAQPPPGRGRGVTITSPRNAYPDRPPDDPAEIERGRALYSLNCAICHGADTRGGDGGPSLLRSGVVLDDRHGELI